MDKKQYIIEMLKENVEIADKTINEINIEIKDINKLPNDCLNIVIDGVVCENNNYKLDILTSHYHVVGYMECLKSSSIELLKLFSMDEKKFDEYLLEQEEIHKHNKEEMKKLDELLKKES